MKNFLTQNKKIIGKLALLLLVLATISCLSVLILRALDVIYFEDGIHFHTERFRVFTDSWYGWLCLIAVQVILTILLSFVPGFSMAFILLIQTLVGTPWKAFLMSFIGVVITSLLMYLMGKFGGYKLCQKLLGEKDCQRASELLNHKGAVYFPLMMLFPVFPDDALVMIAGTLKMSLYWFIPSIVVCRSIGIATIVFGLGSVPFHKFTTPWHWIAFVLLCIVLIVAVFFAAYKFNAFLEKRKERIRAEERESK